MLLGIGVPIHVMSSPCGTYTSTCRLFRKTQRTSFVTRDVPVAAYTSADPVVVSASSNVVDAAYLAQGHSPVRSVRRQQPFFGNFSASRWMWPYSSIQRNIQRRRYARSALLQLSNASRTARNSWMCSRQPSFAFPRRTATPCNGSREPQHLARALPQSASAVVTV
jgi:hypothetical protein